MEMSNTSQIRMGDGKTAKIIGIRKIKIQTKLGHNRVRNKVYYIPKFRTTHAMGKYIQLLLMINALLSTRIGICVQYAYNIYLLVGQRMFLIYILDLFEFSMISNKIDASMIFHQMYGHLHFNDINLLDAMQTIDCRKNS